MSAVSARSSKQSEPKQQITRVQISSHPTRNQTGSCIYAGCDQCGEISCCTWAHNTQQTMHTRQFKYEISEIISTALCDGLLTTRTRHKHKKPKLKVAIDSEMTATGGRIIRFRCAQRSRRLPLLLFLLSAARRFLSPISCDEREMDHAAAARRPSSLLRRRLPHLLTNFFSVSEFFPARGNRFGSCQNITPPIQLCARAFAVERDIAFWHGSSIARVLLQEGTEKCVSACGILFVGGSFILG
jgi:hypothetical protein